MLNTKNVLMLVVLSAGMLTALTGTGVSQVQTAFADDYEQEIEQDNDCKIVNKNEDSEHGQVNNNDNELSCWNFGQNPKDGDAINRDDAFRELEIN